MVNMHQDLPRSGPAREALRAKGQFWTPDWVAEAMVAYVLGNDSEDLFDPAVGSGAFLRAAKVLGQERGWTPRLLGTEVDPQVLSEARATGLSDSDIRHIEVRDFLLEPPEGPFKAIVANPPYVRHHRLPVALKTQLRALGTRILGRPLDGRAGIHVYFLLQALRLLSPEQGRLAFIMPADTCEGVFAPGLWEWITRHYRLEAVVTFDAEASPFLGVDTNPIIFLICRAEPAATFLWARCIEQGTKELKRWITSGFAHIPDRGLVVHQRDLAEGLATGLSRPPLNEKPAGPSLAEFATVVRGIVTGANDFFLLTREKAKRLGIPEAFLLPAIARTRDVAGCEITRELLDELEASGRPTLLLCPDGRRLDQFPEPVRNYLEHGECIGLPRRPLIMTRNPWYKMEARRVPPILFAYLGRRRARFVRNRAGVVPLTGFLCVYPRSEDTTFVEKLWSVLDHPVTVQNLSLVGKSYGSGCIKVEPRALERLPLPEDVVERVGLESALQFAQKSLPFE